MSSRQGVAVKPGWLILLALAVGLTMGWFGKGATMQHRYMQSLAEQHEASKRFWDMKTAQILTENTLRRNEKR